jgi:hypothetical protein
MGFGKWEWRWRKRLFAWKEEHVVECCAILKNYFLQVNINDSWKWLLDPFEGYSIKCVYHFLTKEDQEVLPVIWTNLLPL